MGRGKNIQVMSRELSDKSITCLSRIMLVIHALHQDQDIISNLLANRKQNNEVKEMHIQTAQCKYQHQCNSLS